jgi:uncharacterized protein YaaN involved in tellurite resistance
MTTPQPQEQQPRQPKNIFEQLLFGMQTVNENVVELFKDMEDMRQKVDAIYNALYPAQTDIAEPTDPGAATINDQ